MPIATDPLSLVFIASFLFGLLFLVAATLLGSLGHGTNGVHGGTHVGHIDAGHTTHVGHIGAGHNNTHLVHTPHQVGKGSLAKTNGGANNTFPMLTYANPTSIALFALGFGFFGLCLSWCRWPYASSHYRSGGGWWSHYCGTLTCSPGSCLW